jgi:hypothetical protein
VRSGSAANDQRAPRQVGPPRSFDGHEKGIKINVENHRLAVFLLASSFFQ